MGTAVTEAVASIQPQSAETGELHSVVADALKYAVKKGATDALIVAGRDSGYEVSVRLGEIEKVEHSTSINLGVKVFVGQRTGSASTSAFDRDSIADTVDAAISIAGFSAEDPCNGLPEVDRLAWEFKDLELYQPWEIDRETAADLALECENAARAEDMRIVNSEGATLSTGASHMVLGNCSDFQVADSSTKHSMSCIVVGASENGMQRDYWYSSVCDPKVIETPVSIGRAAANRTLRRLDARKIDTCKVPVLFEAPIASSILSHFIGAISGSNLYRKTSFLVDHAGKQVFPDWVRIHEQPHLKRTLGSSPFDSEGVKTKASDIVSDGILRRYVLSTYSARKLGLETTGNAGGVNNLTIDHGERDLEALLKLMDRGLLVTELIGFGVNLVNGDYSRGASGFWVENGEIQYPVEEFTVAGNLREMMMSIVDVGSDVDLRGNIRTGSILIENMSAAGQ